MSEPFPNRARAAFTIVELLVVVSLIVLLIALLLPTLGQARQRVRAVICKSNLRQLGFALKLYRNDTRHYTGAHTWGTAGHGGVWIVWPARLRTYTGPEADVFWCPIADPTTKWDMLRINPGLNLPAEWGYEANEIRLVPGTGFSDGYNNWGTHDFAIPQRGLGGLAGAYDNPPDPNTVHWGELPEAQVKAPSHMFAIGDSSINGSWDAFIDHNQPPEYPAYRHFDDTHILFCDGNVRELTFAETITGTPDEMARWNNDNKP